jgi:catechol 2,3-dioxygenase-like lactoylglutathione lyase family enzyme
MRERVTANLPARDLGATEAFYGRLGFARAFRDDGWMILRRGPLEIEFFPHPGLDPATSSFSACLRVADAGALHAQWSALGFPAEGIPRLAAPGDEPWGWRIFALVDPDGSLLPVMSPLPSPGGAR